MDAFNKLFAQTRPAFNQQRVFHRALDLATNSLLALGKWTITGILSAGGKLFQDWSATYRLFGKERIKQKELFAPVIKDVLRNIDAQAPLRLRGGVAKSASFRIGISGILVNLRFVAPLKTFSLFFAPNPGG